MDDTCDCNPAPSKSNSMSGISNPTESTSNTTEAIHECDSTSDAIKYLAKGDSRQPVAATDSETGLVSMGSRRHSRRVKAKMTQTKKAKEMFKQSTQGMLYVNAHTASLLLRGLRTLALRMTQHGDNALKVATFLQGHNKILRVAYPGLASHPDHVIARKVMIGYSGMMMFEVKGGRETAVTVIENVRTIKLSVSLGGVASNIEHPASMSRATPGFHGALNSEGIIGEGCVRLSVGIEDADDLIDDLAQALDKVRI